MNILIVNHEIGVGGAAHSLIDLSQELIKRNHNIYVLTPYNKGPLYDKLNNMPVKVIYEPFYWWRMHYDRKLSYEKARIKWFLIRKRKNIEIARRIADYALENKIDIIHSNTSAVNMGALISKYSRIPHIWHIREFGNLDAGMEFYEREAAVYSFMNRYTRKFVCVSRAVSDYYSELDNDKKIVIYNGVSPECCATRTKSEKRETVNILIAGTVFPFKGQEEAVEACGMLLKRGISNFKLYIAGFGDLYFDIPEELSNHVEVLGVVYDMNELREQMDIELMCSRYEAFGRVTAEAMLGGLAVIGTNSGGTPELIQDGINGFLYDSGNPMELSDRLEYLIVNPQVREKIGRTAAEYAKSRFLIKRCADEMENLYNEVVKSNC